MPDEEGVVFAPETFAEHDGALSYVRRLSRTRSPLGRQKRYPRIIPGYWGKLAAGATITAANGLSLGSGSVKLCDREGTVFNEDESIAVANAGNVLTAGISGAVVPLEWTDGEWSTCVCGTAPTTGFNVCGCTGVPGTLRFTDSVLGSLAINKIAGTNIWLGDLAYTYPGLPGLPCNGDTPCLGVPVTVRIVLDATTGATCHLSVNWQVGGSSCPAAGSSGPNFIFVPLAVTCTPFHATASVNLATALCETRLLYRADTGTVNYTITP